MKLPRHPLTAHLLAALYLLVILAPSLEILAQRAEAAGTVDFPCANHRCGCTDALDCQRGCCCSAASEAEFENVMLVWSCTAGSDETPNTIAAAAFHLRAEWASTWDVHSIPQRPTKLREDTRAYSDPPEAVPLPTS